MSAIFLSWTRFHGRSQGIADALGIPSHYISGGTGNRLVRYIKQWRETRVLLRDTDPSCILLMQPPVLALLAIYPYARAHHVLIGGDLHTGVFSDPKWKWATRITLGILKRVGFCIVTNEELASRPRARRVETLVLDDLIEELQPDHSEFEDPKLQRLENQRFVLVPLAYAHDEPLDAILETARRSPGQLFALTGSAPDKFMAVAPENVFFTGFVSNNDYLRLLSRAGAVLGLTVDEVTMQRAGYEALSMGTALITSETRVLKEYFAGAALLVRPWEGEFSRSLELFMTELEVWRARMFALRSLKLEEQVSRLTLLRERISR